MKDSCTGGGQGVDSTRLCSSCLAILAADRQDHRCRPCFADYMRKRRGNLRHRGLCIHCGRSNPTGSSRCDGCRSDHAERSLRRGRGLVEAGRCFSCGRTNPSPFATCEVCRRRKSASQKEARATTKLEIFRRKGSRCEDCGWAEPILDAYDLHHLDPSQKELSFAETMHSVRRRQDVLAEAEKAVLLCARCHRIRHYFMKVDDEISRETDTP